MNNNAKKLLNNWVENLDYEIGDTLKAIEKRKKEHAQEVEFRKDLLELIDFIEKNEIPEGAHRALLACLKWNPHATK